MSLKAILFDLDGTLLPMDQDVFVGDYFRRLAAYMTPFGYDPKVLVDAVWKGTAAMIRNNGTCSNEDAFWRYFQSVFGERVCGDQKHFDSFYREQFPKVKDVCGFDEKIPPLIDRLKKQGVHLILATNPIFPAVATEQRIGWAGLSPADFELVTTYENSRFSKPNPAYYKDILEKLSLSAEECLMIGNDADDDLAASSLGMPVFLLTDWLINRKQIDLSSCPRGDLAALESYLAEKI